MKGEPCMPRENWRGADFEDLMADIDREAQALGPDAVALNELLRERVKAKVIAGLCELPDCPNEADYVYPDPEGGSDVQICAECFGEIQ
jgi:hypothetical protein